KRRKPIGAITASRLITPDDSHRNAVRFLRAAPATRAAFSFSGSAGFPSSAVYRFTTERRTPCFTSHFAKFMQVRLPVRVFLQIFSDVLREQNVSGIAAVHDPLCHIDAGASHV